MYSVKKTFSALGCHIYRSVTSPKVWAAILIIFTQLFQTFSRTFGAEYALSDLSGQWTSATIALLIIFSELPFDDPQQFMLVVRTGKRCWYISQFIYVLTACAAIEIFSFAASYALALGNVDFSQGADAFCWTRAVGFFVSVVFGTAVFELNSVKRYVGTVFGAVLIGYNAISTRIAQTWSYYVSILGWRQASVAEILGETGRKIMICALCVIYLAEIALVILISRKRKDLRL